MQVTYRSARSVLFLLWTAPLILALPQRTESQPTLSIDVEVLGAATEPNPGNPSQLLTILFVGQPALFEVTITNSGEEPQNVFAGGGGGGGFVFESAGVSPEEAGSCTVSETQTFVDCPSLIIQGMGAGKRADLHNTAQILIRANIVQVGTGGFSFFVGNEATSEAHSIGAPAEVREVTETRTLTVESLPPVVDIDVTPGDAGATNFSRDYAVGTHVTLKAPNEISTLVGPLFFYGWSVDSGGRQDNLRINVEMDTDHTALAEYGAPTLMGLMRIGESNSSGKRLDPVDIYANGFLIVDDLGEDHVTPFTVVPLEATIEVTDGADQDNSNPLMSFLYESDGAPAHILITEDAHFVNQNARTEAGDPTQNDVALFVLLPAEIADGIQVVHRTSSTETELFGPNSPFNENRFTPYASLPPGSGVVEILDRTDGAQLDAFQGELAEGGAVLGVLRENGAGKRQGFTLLLFDAEGEPVETAVVTSAGDETVMPSSFALHGNYPNPFNPETVIRFDVSARAHVRVDVLNPLGQLVERLVDEPHAPGAYSAVFEALDLPSGTYFYRMTAGGFTETRPMVVLR